MRLSLILLLVAGATGPLTAVAAGRSVTHSALAWNRTRRDRSSQTERVWGAIPAVAAKSASTDGSGASGSAPAPASGGSDSSKSTDQGSQPNSQTGSGSQDSQTGSDSKDSHTGSHSKDSQGDGGSDGSDQSPGTGDLPASAAAGVKALSTPDAPKPTLGHSVAAAPAAGTVRVQAPGTKTFVALTRASAIPVGSIIDARGATVVLATALPGPVPEQMATLGGGEFRVGQSASAGGLTDIYLAGGSFAACGRAAVSARSGSAHAARSRHAAVRTLWASDNHGQFRTHGRSSVATVRGTAWVTVDRCDGTLTKVSKGLVSVHDLRGHRTVLVSAGHSHLARAR